MTPTRRLQIDLYAFTADVARARAEYAEHPNLADEETASSSDPTSSEEK